MGKFFCKTFCIQKKTKQREKRAAPPLPICPAAQLCCPHLIMPPPQRRVRSSPLGKSATSLRRAAAATPLGLERCLHPAAPPAPGELRSAPPHHATAIALSSCAVVSRGRKGKSKEKREGEKGNLIPLRVPRSTVSYNLRVTVDSTLGCLFQLLSTFGSLAFRIFKCQILFKVREA